MSTNCAFPKDFAYRENEKSQVPENILIGKTALQLINIIKDDTLLYNFLYYSAEKLQFKI